MSKNKSPHFFWDESNNKKSRSRFNLLLLEYGEYFLEDLSVYHFPMPTSDLSKVFEISDSSKIQGRLKLSTRSIIFEPNDVRYPLLKFPYKSMTTALEVFNLKQSEIKQLSVSFSGFFTFMCLNYFEIKANDKIGPYKLMESSASDSGVKGHRMLFALVHSDLTNVLVKIEQFRHILGVSEKHGSARALQLLQPFIDTALLTSFDSSHLVDFHEKLLLSTPIAVKKIKPLIINPGSLMLTNSRVYFQPSNMNNIADSILHFEIAKITRIFKRRYLLRQVGLEVLLPDNISYLFAFDSSADRDYVYNVVIQQNNSLCRQPSLESVTRRWQNKEISNFDYLMYLNNEADRSGNDLTQYPVFPHVVADFTSKKLSLSKASTFRDLSKPIGALNAERLKYFKDRYHSMPEADLSCGIPPPFLYGTHYSTPGYVLFYLVRVAPEYMLCLQNGKFDAPDRMFHSIGDTYDSCLTNHADLKELIPEFYCGSGEFLVNYNNLDLGHRHTGERLYDVVLPPWADSPRDFIRKMAKALESDYVSEHLHEWIDLIFGFKQKGAAAVEADNLYYYLTYEGSVDVESIQDQRERSALEVQIQEFGQTPKQLFTMPHVKRFDNNRNNVASGGGAAAVSGVTGKNQPSEGSPSNSRREAEEAAAAAAAKAADINRRILDLLSDGTSSQEGSTSARSSRKGSGDVLSVSPVNVPPVLSSGSVSGAPSAPASTPMSPSNNLNNLNNSNYYLGMKMSNPNAVVSPPSIELLPSRGGSSIATRAAYRSSHQSELDRILAEAENDPEEDSPHSRVSNIAILDLDDEFKMEVQRELNKQQQQQSQTSSYQSRPYSSSSSGGYTSSNNSSRPVSHQSYPNPPPAPPASASSSSSGANSGAFSYPSIASVRKPAVPPPAPEEEQQQQQTSGKSNSSGGSGNSNNSSSNGGSSSGGAYRFNILNKFLSKA